LLVFSAFLDENTHENVQRVDTNRVFHDYGPKHGWQHWTDRDGCILCGGHAA
jgi:hypothetical protein